MIAAPPDAPTAPTTGPSAPAAPRRRWWRAGLLLAGVAGAGLALAACELEAATVAVTTTADAGRDAVPGDGICEITPGAGDCSLRAAVDEANATPGAAVTVEVPPGTYALTRPGVEDANDGGDLDVGNLVFLRATGEGVVIDAGGIDRAVDAEGVVGLHGITVTGGATEGDGGAVRSAGPSLLVVDTTVTGSTAAGRGGGIAVTGGRAVVDGSTVAGNEAGTAGGGLAIAPGATAEVARSTITGNAAGPGPATAPTTGLAGPLPVVADPAVPVGGLAGRAGGGSGSAEAQPVIVELAVDARPEAVLAPGARSLQRARIAATAEDALADAAVPGRHDPELRRRYATVPYVAMEVDAAGLAELRRSPAVRAVHPDTLAAPALGESIDQVRAGTAQAAGATGAGTVLAVLDTGVDTAHPMVSGAVVAEACFAQGTSLGDAVGDCPDGTPDQVGAGAGAPCPWAACWHGTHVASVAAGRPVTSGAATLRGVAPEAGVVAINVFSRFTSQIICGTGVTECVRSWASDQLAALDHVQSLLGTHPVVAVNMSLVGGSYPGSCDGDPRAGAIGALRAAGVVAAISSGNDGNKAEIGAPGCVSAALTVGASEDAADAVAGFSNSSATVDVLAPGVDITAAYPGASLATASGTSMAAPHVAGAVAALAGAHPGATPDQLEAALEATGVPITDPGNGLTLPRIDVAAALGWLAGWGTGGGIANDGTTVLLATTVADNDALWGSAVGGTGATTVHGSLLVAPADGQRSCGLAPGGSVLSAGHNLVGDAGCGLSGVGDLSGVDPLLGPLGDHGGPTWTRLPAAGSPAIDAVPVGTTELCDGTPGRLTDQRDVARPVGAACDVGATEQ